MDADAELLDPRPGDGWVVRRPPRWLVVGVLLLVAAGVTGWYADQAARAHESAELRACQRELHNAVVSSDLEMVAVAGNLRPRLAATSGRRHAAVASLMAVPAHELLPEVVAADHHCRSVSVPPWHPTLRSRRDAATAYSSALVIRLRQVAGDGRTYYRDDRRLRHLRRAADLGVIGGRY